MADVILTFKLMPESPDTDREAIKSKASKLIEEFEGKVKEVSEEPVAFGLIATILEFSVNEDKGSPDELEEALCKVEGVESVSCIGCTRALG